MNSKYTRTLVSTLLVVVLMLASLGIFYVLDMITFLEFKDYATKATAVTVIIGLAAVLISTMLGSGRTKE